MRFKDLLRFLVFTSLIPAQAGARHTITATRLSGPINLDGSSLDRGWALTTPIVSELEVYPAEKVEGVLDIEVAGRKGNAPGFHGFDTLISHGNKSPNKGDNFPKSISVR